MRVSVVIPTFNGADTLAPLLDNLRNQKPVAPDEIIAIDSGSSDDTCRIVREAGGHVITFRGAFNHGLTRDAVVRAASHEIVFLTVQDALPASSDFLSRVAAHFNDPAIAGVTTRQIPPPDGPLELRIKAALEEQQEQCIERVSLGAHPNYSLYTPRQKIELYRFDNVCSAIRRSVWETIPFGKCRYAEDYQWARKVLEAGHTLARDALAPVIHAHRRPFWYEFRRALLDAWVLDETFGYRYRLIDKLDRVKHLASAHGGTRMQMSLKARLKAVKTYSAHVLAREVYWGYRTVLKPMGMGTGNLERLTDRI